MYVDFYVMPLNLLGDAHAVYMVYEISLCPLIHMGCLAHALIRTVAAQCVPYSKLHQIAEVKG